MPQPPEKLRALVEGYLAELALMPELGSLEEPMRHALGGKRVRPILCLATGDAIGAPVENLLPAAAAVELVHSFSLVHDDLPALDDEDENRGAPSVGAPRGGRRRRGAGGGGGRGGGGRPAPGGAPSLRRRRGGPPLMSPPGAVA